MVFFFIVIKNERDSHKRRKSDKVSFFTIGVKLIIINAVIVFVSLGVITFVVHYLIGLDFQRTADTNNFEVNVRSAREVERTFSHIHSNSLVLIQTISAAEGRGSLAGYQAVRSILWQNRNIIAAIFFSLSGQMEHQVLFNDWFYRSEEIDGDFSRDWFEGRNETMARAALDEKTILLNAAPDFGIPLLAMFFPLPGGSGGVLFSPEGLTDSLDLGANKSYLLSSKGDALIGAANLELKDFDFIGEMRESGMQHLQKRKGDHLAAFYELNNYDSILITAIKMDTVFEQWKVTVLDDFYMAFIVFFLSGFFIWFFSKSISVPIKALTRAAQSIEGGNFDIKLSPQWYDEIGALTASFGRMSWALNVFGKFTNKEIAIQAMHRQIKPGGLQKHATIFFSDIRGFTEKSENFTKEFGGEASDKIVYWLNDYFTRMVECVQKTGGVVDKFIGDAVMAHWGTAYTSGSPAHDAYNCIKAALMMRIMLLKMNKNRSLHDRGNPPISIGCGINTGMVTAGQIGSDLRMEYTVIGDPVNLASRAEALNKPFGTDILITEDTWHLVKRHIIAEEMPSVEVKGKEKPVRLFAVIGLSAISRGPRTLTDLRKLLRIKTPDLSRVDTNAEEKKYKISGAE